MKNIQTVVLMFLIIFITCFDRVQSQEVPEGMESVTVGGSQYIVPIGTKIKQVGSQIIVEDTKEYMARKVKELTEQLIVMAKNDGVRKQEMEILQQEISTLKKIIEELQKKSEIKSEAAVEELK